MKKLNWLTAWLFPGWNYRDVPWVRVVGVTNVGVVFPVWAHQSVSPGNEHHFTNFNKHHAITITSILPLNSIKYTFYNSTTGVKYLQTTCQYFQEKFSKCQRFPLKIILTIFPQCDCWKLASGWMFVLMKTPGVNLR